MHHYWRSSSAGHIHRCKVSLYTIKLYHRLRASTFSDIVVKDGYVFISNYELFDGKISKEEVKDTEDFVKELIQNVGEDADSPYPPGYLNEYYILFKLEDLAQVTFTDAQIINNIKNKVTRNKIWNERSERTLKKFGDWDILTEVLPKTEVKLSIGVGLVLRHLDTFLDVIVCEYSYLNIIEIQSFYFMEEETIKSLDSFLKANKLIKKVDLKVCFAIILIHIYRLKEKIECHFYLMSYISIQYWVFVLIIQVN